MIANSLMYQGGGDRRVYSSGKRANYLIKANLFFDLLDRIFHKPFHRPGLFGLGDTYKFSQNFLSVCRMRDLGVELNPVDSLTLVSNGNIEAIFGFGRLDKALG